MATRRARVSTGRGNDIVVVNQPAPVRRRSSGGRRRRSTKRRRRSSSSGGASYQKRLQGVAIGGLAYGLLIKNFGTSLPRLPGIGRSGTVALAAYFFNPKNQILRDAGIAAAAIAGASFGETGTVSGEDDDDDDVLVTDGG